MNIDQKDIEQYLSEVKEAVEKDNYRLDRNARRVFCKPFLQKVAK